MTNTANAAPTKPVRVAVVDGGPTDRFVEAMRRELQSAGFLAVVRGQEPRPQSFAQLARELAVLAVIRGAPGGRGVEVWIESAVTGRPLVRQLVIDEGIGPPNADLVALQTVEVLRSALAATSGSVPSRPAAPAVRAQPSPVEAAMPAWGVLLGPAIVVSPGGVGPTFGLKLGAYRRLSRLLALEGFGLMPLGSSRLAAVQGGASAQTRLAGVGTRFWPAGDHGPLVPTLSAGVGASWLRFEGRATPPLVSATEDALSPLLYAEASVALRLNGAVALAAAICPALATTRVNVDFAGSRAAVWGPFVTSAGLALELAW